LATDEQGGEPAFSVVVTNVGYAQEGGFAKLGSFPERCLSGLFTRRLGPKKLGKNDLVMKNEASGVFEQPLLQ
jgi:hypothetical protein